MYFLTTNEWSWFKVNTWKKYLSNNSSKNKNIISNNVTLSKDGLICSLNKKLITMHRMEYKKNKNKFLMLVFLLLHKITSFLNNNILINKSETGVVYKYSEWIPPTLLKTKLPLLENDKKTGRKIANENIENLLFITIFLKA